MLEGILESFNHALMITGFVFVVMLLIEYVNIASSGVLRNLLGCSPIRQYLFAALLGAIPGCFGTFAVAALYSHGMITIGAVVSVMVATSGDGAFIMLSLIPLKALGITAFLILLGVASGFTVDKLLGVSPPSNCNIQPGFIFHDEDECITFSASRFISQWKNCTPARGILTVVLSLFLAGIFLGWFHELEWNWIGVSVTLSVLAALLMVITVPDHFLEEHLWNHVAKIHIKKIFLWTFGALLVMHLLLDNLELERLISENHFLVLLMALLISLIPDSGPQLIFVTLYASGALPLSILLANSVSQDGHGMLPILAESRRDFIKIKSINFTIGLLIGLAALALGF
ncbi:MAG: hypothetical protein C0609_06980 [Deltaproteobacteria bacterium]|nr:MAG: hypothetical protein C0609_06980 [Deltaproteobacteria bacterium]